MEKMWREIIIIKSPIINHHPLINKSPCLNYYDVNLATKREVIVLYTSCRRLISIPKPITLLTPLEMQ